ncbi:MAG: ATP-dependent zinc protease [Acidimicrobiales bacterium]|nr:ATP-dependent zinc protease [Acidimicrobiales bacterium]
MTATVVGWREWVRLPDLLPDSEPVKAKLDTGARTSAIHAWDIEEVERDGARWVRFWLHPRQDDDEHVVQVEARLVEEREVRSSNGEIESRCVIATNLALGDEVWPIELTLANRDEMGFRMLLGRTAMKRRVLVDPSASFRTGGGVSGPAR